MKYNQGWTLIELVLTLFLIGVVGTLVFKVSFGSSLFNRYMFSHDFMASVAKARSFVLYSDMTVDMAINDNQFIFTPIDNQGQSQQSYAWAIDIPKKVVVTQHQFPIKLGKDQSKEIKVSVDNYVLTLEPRTIYAYQKTVTP